MVLRHPSLKNKHANCSNCVYSYSWVNDHVKLVHRLEKHLSLAWIPVLLDIKDNKAGTEISRFTEAIGKSDFVLVALSRKLKEKYDATSGSVLNLEIGQIFNKQLKQPTTVIRSKERRVGKECVSTFRSQ